jgi:WD40 repeat protein
MLARMGEVKPERVFISYSRRDAADLALRLRDDLTEAGYHAWLDTAQIGAGSSWTREIEEAIDRCTVLLALLTEASYLSECCRAEQLHALRKGKRVIPVLVQSEADRPLHLEHLHYRDLSDDERYLEKFKVLLLDVSGGTPVPLPDTFRQTYVTAPKLPPNFIPRPEELADLRRAVIGDGTAATTALTALRGLGGIGKSVLAQALCQDKVIQEAFPDGVIWISIGREPGDLVRQMREVGRALRDGPEHYDTPNGSINRLRTILRDRAALLVLDDVWDKRHVDPFLVEAPRCRVLFTTRNGNIALSLCAGEIKLGVFQPVQAVELLREWAGRDDPAFPDISKRLGYLPLALKLAGAQLREGTAGAEWLTEPPHVSQMFLDFCSEDPTENLESCFDLSVKRLPKRYQTLYHALGIFPEDVPVPQAVIARLWKQLDGGLGDADWSNLLKQLSRLALVEMGSDRTVTLHDLLYDYNRGKLGVQQTASLHNCLLDAYNHGPGPWHSVPDDGYLYRHLSYHLPEAGRKEELRRLLFDFHWLLAKLEATDIAALIADYRSLPDDADLRLVRGALVLSAHILSRDKSQLAGQLTGRLLSFQSSAIQGLLEKTRSVKLKAWLRPLTASLTPPGGPLLRTLVGHSGRVWAGAVTADGRRAVTTSEDCTVKVWDLESGAELRNLAGHTFWANALAVTPDGRRALSASVDGTVKVWDLETGSQLRSLAGPAVGVNAVALTPDGERGVMACEGLALQVWDLENEVLLRSLGGHTCEVHAVAVTADGSRVVATSKDLRVNVWDLESGALLHTLVCRAEHMNAVAVTADGRRAVTASEDCTLKVWDLERGVLLRTLPGQGIRVHALAVTADGRWALTGSHDGTVRLWDLESEGRLGTSARHAGAVSAMAATPDGKRAITASFDRTMKVWNLETGAELHTLVGHTDRVWAVAISANGGRALSGSADGVVKEWDLETGSELRTFRGHADCVTAVAVTADGRRAASGSIDGRVKVWDLEGGTQLRTLACHTNVVNDMAMTPDGRLALSASADHTVKAWHLESGRALRILMHHWGGVNALAVAPDGRRILTGSDDCTVRVWDLGSWTEVLSLRGHDGSVSAVAITADGRRALSASQDKAVKVWDMETGAELGTMGGHARWVRGVVVSTDGRRVVSNDGTVRVWDMESGRTLACFSGDSAFRACTIAPDGATVVAGEASGAVHFLRLEEVEALML